MEGERERERREVGGREVKMRGKMSIGRKKGRKGRRRDQDREIEATSMNLS